MKIEGLHEKEIFSKEFPFRMIINRNYNFNYPPHWHNAVELVYNLKNAFEVTVNSKKYELREHDILFIPGGDIHEFHSKSPTGLRVFLNYELSVFTGCTDMREMNFRLHSVQHISPEDGSLHTRFEQELQKLLIRHKTDELSDELFYTARIFDLLSLLCRCVPHDANPEGEKSRIIGLEKINKSLAFIEKNYTEDISLADIAEASGFSVNYFSSLFKEITEKNFHQYLNEYRIKKAEVLLTDSNKSVSDTAYAVGFGSIATFDRIFRKIKGCSPKNFRKLREEPKK